MQFSRPLPAVASALVAILLAGCSSNPRASVPVPQTAPRPTATVTAPPPAPKPDPVAALVAESEKYFDVGQRELSQGHLTESRSAFDRALAVLLEAPQGARLDPRLRDQFDRLVDRISGLEASALAAGDAFAEKSYEPATIDDLLSSSAFNGPTPPTPPELTRAVEADLAATQHDLPIPTQARVLAYVELFSGKLHDWMQTSLQRGTRYLPMIQNVFRAEGLPLDLAYVPLIESAFRPNALSRAQAKGVWQFMKDTAQENGLRQDWYVDERADPEKATLAAARYLRTLYNMFDDWHLALASYNGGPGRVQRALKVAGTSDFWELSQGSRFLPRETREYVPMILAAIIIGRNPAQYGFDVQPDTAIAYETVEVPAATDLRRLAEWTGMRVDELQLLNPELRRWTTPVQPKKYAVKVPVGTASQVQGILASAPPSELSSLRWHTVARGDTWTSLARRFKVPARELADANRVSTRSPLRAGQNIVIPSLPGPFVSARNLQGSSPSVARTASRANSSDDVRTTYVVRRGDTLFGIAKRFGTSVEALKSLNNLRANTIAPGDRLTVVVERSLVAAK